ncbi:hypothetical protein [Azospirillum thermophilum]|uniref:Uncharacterized protein n=1 Tax=Azospirillum thermophilum TaxID=2202148 RepID=A0A2S2CVZ1_9PROT|nr:hypothetical protein [Azospirillum thermophilum]AWK88575.1 hypothetical protein DEW08_20955 [Azospirillum thermophilum]
MEGTYTRVKPFYDLPQMGNYFIEYRDMKTLLWEDDDGDAPAHVIDGVVSLEGVRCYLSGHAAGEKRGYDRGRAAGVAAVQAGLRALLGAASANDVEVLTREALTQ